MLGPVIVCCAVLHHAVLWLLSSSVTSVSVKLLRTAVEALPHLVMPAVIFNMHSDIHIHLLTLLC